MNKVLTIWSKEFKGYFHGPSFYIVSGLYTAFLSFSFFMLLKHFAKQSMFYMAQTQGHGEGVNLHGVVFVGLISNINLILLILVPFLTVRLLTEEKKLRTFDLLLTSPITSMQIVLGKYLAALSVVWSFCLISLIYPASLLFFTKIQWGVLISSYMGLLMIAAIYVAIGLFASSLTSSVILSGFIALILSLGLWFIAWTSVVVEDATLQSIFEHLSVSQHFGEFMKGSIAITGFVFSLSVVAIYVFLTERVVESMRWRA